MNDATTPAPEAKKGGIKWDSTFNIPTIITIFSLALGSGIWLATKWQEMDTRVAANATSNASTKEAVLRLEIVTSEQRRDYMQKIDSMRSEARDDRKDLSNKLDQLLYRVKAEK